MPQTIKKEDGTEEEFYSKAELDEIAGKKAEEERVRIEAEKEAEKNDLQGKLEETQELLRKEQDKEKNFKNLRDSKDKDTGKTEELANTVKALQEQITKITEQPIAAAKKSFIEKNIGTDKEAVDKFNLYFNKVGKDAKTPEEVDAALKEAQILTTGGKVTGNGGRDNRATSTGVDNSSDNTSGEESEASKAFAKAFGITEDDKKKHGKGEVNLF